MENIYTGYIEIEKNKKAKASQFKRAFVFLCLFLLYFFAKTTSNEPV
jgi:hypothetical protein